MVKEDKSVTAFLTRERLEEYILREQAVSQGLIQCALEGDLAGVTRELRQVDVWVNAATSRGRTALHVAAANGHLEVATLLVESGASF